LSYRGIIGVLRVELSPDGPKPSVLPQHFTPGLPDFTYP